MKYDSLQQEALKILLGESQHNLNEETKLERDIKSLKKTGWKLDKIIRHLVTQGDDYDMKLTSDLITDIYNGGTLDPKNTPSPSPLGKDKWVLPKDSKTGVYMPIMIAKTKPKTVKTAEWPSNPPMSKRNDASHAESWLSKVIASGESPDITGAEAYQLMLQAGYTDRAAIAVTKNILAWDEKDRDKFLKRNTP